MPTTFEAERELRATEILESIPDGFFAFDRSWRFTYVNRAAERILGEARSTLVGRVLWEAFPGLVGSVFEPGYRRAMTERAATGITSYYPDHARWYQVHTYPAPGGIAIYFRDVTEEKLAEAERERLAAESERQRRIYEAALSNTPDLVYVFDLGHRFTYANEALLKMWGRTREEAIGRNCLELGYEPWHAEMHDREIDQVVATKRPIRGEVPFTGTNGRRIYDYIFVPVLGSAGEVVAVAGTTRDVTDRKQAEQAIREQAGQLREADRAKDEFLATLAHELRNPLAPLRNAAYIQGRLDIDDPRFTKTREIFDRQISHLSRLVDDLLDLSRVNRGAFALRKAPVQVAAIVRHALESGRPAIEAAGHRLELSLPEEPLWVEGDSVRLAQVVANLLDNAAKYTPDRGRLAVHVRREGEAARISVADDGEGIDAESLSRVFEMFTRGGAPRSRSQEGLGIGLALARRLVQMHGGSIEAKSEGPGRGSEFTVRLPLRDAPEARASEPAPPQAPGRRRVLVVDDNADAADSLAALLQLLGAEVRVARDGPEALAQFSDYDPALVLLDIGMPGMDGYEVARRIRRGFPERRPILVALTGWGQNKDRGEAAAAGFDHHLVKPADLEVLQSLLRG